MLFSRELKKYFMLYTGHWCMARD